MSISMAYRYEALWPTTLEERRLRRSSAGVMRRNLGLMWKFADSKHLKFSPQTVLEQDEWGTRETTSSTPKLAQSYQLNRIGWGVRRS